MIGDDFLIICSGVSCTDSESSLPVENPGSEGFGAVPRFGLIEGLPAALFADEEILAASGENSGGAAGGSFLDGRITAAGPGFPVNGDI